MPKVASLPVKRQQGDGQKSRKQACVFLKLVFSSNNDGVCHQILKEDCVKAGAVQEDGKNLLLHLKKYLNSRGVHVEDKDGNLYIDAYSARLMNVSPPPVDITFKLTRKFSTVVPSEDVRRLIFDLSKETELQTRFPEEYALLTSTSRFSSFDQSVCELLEKQGVAIDRSSQPRKRRRRVTKSVNKENDCVEDAVVSMNAPTENVVEETVYMEEVSQHDDTGASPPNLMSHSFSQVNPTYDYNKQKLKKYMVDDVMYFVVPIISSPLTNIEAKVIRETIAPSKEIDAAFALYEKVKDKNKEKYFEVLEHTADPSFIKLLCDVVYPPKKHPKVLVHEQI